MINCSKKKEKKPKLLEKECLGSLAALHMEAIRILLMGAVVILMAVVNIKAIITNLMGNHHRKHKLMD